MVARKLQPIENVGISSLGEGQMVAFHPVLGQKTLKLNKTLCGHAFLRGLSQDQITSLSCLADEAVFEENEVILEDGQRSSGFYLLVSGSVAVELRSPRYVVSVQALGCGQVFGWSALLNQQDTLFQVRAREKTTAVRLDGARLKALCHSDPELGAEILQRTLQVVAGRVKATEIRFAEMCGIRV
jgi:CRP/FNR family transcriptional regulator, cyclic AMP receptor protein